MFKVISKMPHVLLVSSFFERIWRLSCWVKYSASPTTLKLDRLKIWAPFIWLKQKEASLRLTFNPELSDREMHTWWSWERAWVWVQFGCTRGICITVVYYGCSSCVLDCEERKQLPKCLRRNVFIISAANAIAVCRMQLFSRTEKQKLRHHIGNREVDREEFTATCLCAPAIARYSPPTFAIQRTSSQSAPDRNECGTERSRPL